MRLLHSSYRGERLKFPLRAFARIFRRKSSQQEKRIVFAPYFGLNLLRLARTNSLFESQTSSQTLKHQWSNIISRQRWSQSVIVAYWANWLSSHRGLSLSSCARLFWAFSILLSFDSMWKKRRPNTQNEADSGRNCVHRVEYVDVQLRYWTWIKWQWISCQINHNFFLFFFLFLLATTQFVNTKMYNYSIVFTNVRVCLEYNHIYTLTVSLCINCHVDTVAMIFRSKCHCQS